MIWQVSQLFFFHFKFQISIQKIACLVFRSALITSDSRGGRKNKAERIDPRGSLPSLTTRGKKNAYSISQLGNWAHLARRPQEEAMQPICSTSIHWAYFVDCSCSWLLWQRTLHSRIIRDRNSARVRCWICWVWYGWCWGETAAQISTLYSENSSKIGAGLWFSGVRLLHIYIYAYRHTCHTSIEICNIKK